MAYADKSAFGRWQIITVSIYSIVKGKVASREKTIRASNVTKENTEDVECYKRTMSPTQHIRPSRAFATAGPAALEQIPGPCQ